MLGNGGGVEIKVSRRLESKENMAGWKEALCKKEAKIVPPSWGLCHSAVWCQLLPGHSQPTSEHEAPSRDADGLSV